MLTPKISILVPSNRDSLHTIGTILQLANYDVNKYEVIIRDNSESKNKFDILNNLPNTNFKVFFSNHCQAEDNFLELLKLATGEFILFLGDDDRIFWDGLNSIHNKICTNPSKDTKIYSGSYLITGANRDFIYNYTDLHNEDANQRIINFINSKANYIFYSVIETGLYKEMFNFSKSMPCSFSFSDQILTLFLICRSKVFVTDRILFNYNYSEWNTTKKAIEKDRSYYIKNGLDPEIDEIHILLQAIEGYIFLKSQLNSAYTNLDTAATFWFTNKFNSFLNNIRSVANSNNTYKACQELKSSLSCKTSIDVNKLLLKVCEIMSISNSKLSENYFNFWSKI